MRPLELGELAFLSPPWLVAALALAALAVAAGRAPARGGWRRVLSPEVLGFLAGGGAARRVDPRLAAAALVALALAAPATRTDEAGTWRHGTAWIALLDASRSMTLDDVVPSRLAAARDAVQALSDAAGARPLALAIHAGDAFLVSPPVFDRTLLETHASLVEHGSVPVEGSNVARALSLATSVAADANLVGARVFLLGDSGGANRNALAAARFLADAGHRLDVLHFGLPDNGLGPGGAVDLDAAARLAEAGGGRLVASDALGAIELDALGLDGDRADVRGLEALSWRVRSHWLLLPLLTLLPWIARRGAA